MRKFIIKYNSPFGTWAVVRYNLTQELAIADLSEYIKSRLVSITDAETGEVREFSGLVLNSYF